MEIWRPVRNFPVYNVSSEGRIRNVRLNHMLKPYIDQYGYPRVSMVKNGRKQNMRVARVVADSFLGSHPGMDVRYKDGNRLNIHVNNLYWSSREETVRDANNRELRDYPNRVPVRVIETGNEYYSLRACASAIDCSPQEISKYLDGRCDHVKGYHFERVFSAHSTGGEFVSQTPPFIER